MTEHEKWLQGRQKRQFEIVRKGLREAARILAEIQMAVVKPVYETIEVSIERVDDVADQYPEDEITLDVSELEMNPSTPLKLLEDFLGKVYHRQYVRDVLEN